MHSSIAAVLVIVSFAEAGLVGPPAALAMVLGANLGSALNPLVAAIAGGRAPCACRPATSPTACSAAASPALPAQDRRVPGRIEPDPGRLAVGFTSPSTPPSRSSSSSPAAAGAGCWRGCCPTGRGPATRQPALPRPGLPRHPGGSAGEHLARGAANGGRGRRDAARARASCSAATTAASPLSCDGWTTCSTGCTPPSSTSWASSAEPSSATASEPASPTCSPPRSTSITRAT